MTIKSQGGIFGRNPTFNDVEVDGTLTVGGNAVPAANTILVDGDIGSTVQAYDADTAKRDTAQTFSGIQSFSNQVNISGGVVSGANNTLTISNGSGQSQLWALGDGSTQGSFLIVQALNNLTNSRQLLGFDTSGNATFYSGNIAVANGNGIDFSATAGTGTSELFSDYEQGSWTPAWSFATSGSVTLGSATGTYTKIGDIVYAYCFVSSTSISSPSGQAKITGLPFSATDFVGASFSLVRRFSTSFSANLRGEVAGTEVYFYDHATDSVPATYLEGSDFSSGGNFNQLRFNIVYKV